MNEQLKAALAEQEQALQQLDAELSKFRDLQMKRDTLFTLVSQMRFALGMGPYVPPETGGQEKDPENAPALAPIWQGAKQLIARHGPMDTLDLANSLYSLGYRQLQGRNGKETLRSILGKKKKVFKRLQDGRFDLVKP